MYAEYQSIPWEGIRTIDEFEEEEILVDDLPIGIEERLKASIYCGYFTQSSINSVCPHFKEVDFQWQGYAWVSGNRRKVHYKNTARVYRNVLITYSECEGNENESVICLECLLKELNKGMNNEKKGL